MQDLNLGQYLPVSELVLEKTQISKPKYPVIDFHTHWGYFFKDDFEDAYNAKDFAGIMKAHEVVHCVNLDGGFGDMPDRMLKKIEGFDNITTFGTVDTSRIDQPDFAQSVRKTLETNYEKGLRGIKLWKNISLGQKDAAGKYVRMDDPRLSVIYDTAAELDIPILAHIADPTAFFKTIDGKNERFEELHAHPDWVFNAPELYKFHELMEMQENMIKNHPKTTFVIAHVGSYAENLKAVAGWLDKYDNMYIDVAARISELGRQPYTSRDFLTKYQDRVLFGTDMFPVCTNFYPIYYRFFETKDEYFAYGDDTDVPSQGRWNIYGVYLADKVLKKIYYNNAATLLGKPLI